jgi:ABC-2 type transport system ATP-binding protein
MLLRALSGLIVPDSGVVKIDDKVLHKDLSFPPSIGIVIENMELLPQFNAFDNLKILSDIKKVATDEDIKNAILKVGLDPDSKMKVRKFSLGMKQRLNIAQAVFEKPDIILLDEPTNALDEESVNKIYDLLFEEKERGAIIIIASHNKEDLSELCDTTIKVVDGFLDVSNPFVKN